MLPEGAKKILTWPAAKILEVLTKRSLCSRGSTPGNHPPNNRAGKLHIGGPWWDCDKLCSAGCPCRLCACP